MKRLRQEDANDPHKSLDFGIDPTLSTSGKKKSKKDDADSSVIDMSTEKALRREHGMSMDMGSPYLLPPGLQGSRESLHSLSRTIHSGDDRYKPATTIVSTDSTSVRSYPNTQRDIDESPSTADSSAQVYGHDSMNQNLLQNAQRMSRSIPPNSRQLTASNTVSNDQFVEAKPKPSPSEGLNPPSGGLLNISSTIPPDTRGSFMSNTGVDLHKSNNYLGPLIHSGEASDDFKPQHPGQSPMMSPQAPLTEAMQGLNGRKSPPAANFTSTISRPPRLESLNPSKELKYTEIFVHDQGDYEESFNLTPPPPKDDAITRRTETVRQPDPKNVPSTDGYVSGGMEASAIGFDARRLSMGVRPLPPDDPTDNPEQRANRIRSFYKEYFDDSKPAPVRGPADYVEDYDQTFLGDGAIFDPASGQFVIAQPQFAEPYARRAMTPPPRAPPRFQGPARHHATTSNGGFVPRGQRAFSSVSGRLGPPGRGPLRAPLPPPSPLRVLPSPHLMKEDSFALPIDFAPPMSYKDRQAGRPESPRGGMRPYSPMTPAHLPLASSFDDLSVMPSP